MRRVAEWCRLHRHLPEAAQHRALIRMLLGHYAYYGRRSNMQSLHRFFEFVEKTWYKWLRRRGQHRRLSWSAYNYGLEHICHHEANSLLITWLLTAFALTIERLYRLRYLHRGTHPVRAAIELLRTLRVSLGRPLTADTS